jgi:hypothetical protein
MPVTEAVPTIAGSTVTLTQTEHWEVDVENSDVTNAFIEGSEIELILTFTLGIVVEPAQITFAGSSVFAALGSGAPTKIVTGQRSNQISITSRAAMMTADSESQEMAVGQGEKL